MTGFNQKRAEISPRQARLIEALLASPTKLAACQTAGVSMATLTRWLQDEAFQAAFRSARRRLFEEGIGRLCSLTAVAVTELERILTDPETSTRDRLVAIKVVLENSIMANGRDIEELAQRLEAALARMEN